MPNRRTLVRFDVFVGYTVHIILAANVANTARRLGHDLTGAVAGFIPDEGKGYLVLGADPDEATVAHEAAHAIRELLERHGAEIDDETFAYHLDFLVGKIHKFLRRVKRA